MPIVVLIAEVATLAWFLVFLTMVRGFLQPGAAMKVGNPDVIGGALLKSSRWAYFVGYGAFFLFTVAALLDNLLALGVGLRL